MNRISLNQIVEGIEEKWEREGGRERQRKLKP